MLMNYKLILKKLKDIKVFNKGRLKQLLLPFALNHVNYDDAKDFKFVLSQSSVWSQARRLTALRNFTDETVAAREINNCM